MIVKRYNMKQLDDMILQHLIKYLEIRRFCPPSCQLDYTCCSMVCSGLTLSLGMGLDYSRGILNALVRVSPVTYIV